MRKPDISPKHRIAIICEGYEEETYIRTLLKLNVWNRYDFKVINAKGASNISARFQSELNADACEAILIFCDTDRHPHQQFRLLLDRLHDILGRQADLFSFIIYANPCTMQIVLLHFGSEPVLLKTQSKHINAPIIFSLTGVRDYKANQHEHIEAICRQISRSNYQLMKERASALAGAYTAPGCTNFSTFLEALESSQPTWLKKIRQQLSGARPGRNG